MKANELMIGDWVFDEIEKQPSKWILECFEFVHHKSGIYDNVSAIPLTEEILKANGFEKDVNEPYGYIICDYGFYWENNILTDGLSVTIKYVHELQHALRICGLNDLADNFKIE